MTRPLLAAPVAVLSLLTACATDGARPHGPVAMTLDPQSLDTGPLPADLVAQQTTGSVGISVYCQADGGIGDAKVVQSSGSAGLDAAALRAARRWRCQAPAGSSATEPRIAAWATSYRTFQPHGREPKLVRPAAHIPYPPAALAAGDAGTVVLSMRCQVDGTVGEVLIPPSGSSGVTALDAAALNAARAWHCTPGWVAPGAAAHPQWLSVAYTFFLDGGPGGIIDTTPYKKKPDRRATIAASLAPLPLAPGGGPLHGRIGFRCEPDGSVSATRVLVSTGLPDRDAALAARVKASRCTPARVPGADRTYAAWGRSDVLLDAAPTPPQVDPHGFLANLDYPDQAIAEGRDGQVLLAYQCGADGKVGDIRIIQPGQWKDLDDSFLRAVAAGARRCRPAHDAKGAAVVGWGLVRFNYNLSAVDN